MLGDINIFMQRRLSVPMRPYPTCPTSLPLILTMMLNVQIGVFARKIESGNGCLCRYSSALSGLKDVRVCGDGKVSSSITPQYIAKVFI